MQSQDSTGNSLKLNVISVITVVMDDPAGFAETLESLEEQSLPQFNWVVVDSSTDPTSIPALLSQSQLSVDYEWVKPEGIYPAMNHGASRSDGKYLYFLNAGDTLFDSMTLAQVTNAVSETLPTWAFGGVNFWDQNGQQLKEPNWDYSVEHRHRFTRGRFPAHQSVFVRSDVFEELGNFDTAFTIAADYHMICRLSQIQDPLALGFKVAHFTQGGASTLSWRLAQTEFRQARTSVFPLNLAGRLEELFFGTRACLSHLVVNRRSKSQ
jgi:glycosyltransferase involved in cell wall biosynthesis